MLWQIIVIALVALVFYLVTLNLWKLWKSLFRPPGINPFFVTRTPKKGLVTDRKARDKVLKNVFTPEKVPSNLDAIVIGSGIGGLTCAAILSKAGKKVLVLEQHDQAGGCCHTYIEKGYEFDVGIHYVGRMEKNSADRVVSDLVTDGQLDWAPLDKEFDVVQLGYDKDTARCYPISSEGAWKECLLTEFPSEHVAIEKFFQIFREWDREELIVIALTKIFPLWISNFLAYTGLINRFTTMFEFHKTSTSEAIKNLTDNKDLQATMMYNFGDMGTFPDQSGFTLQATLHNHFSKGAFYPVGGASEIAFNIIPVIEQSGGAVLMRARVNQIIVNKSREAAGVKVVKNGSTGAQEMVCSAPLIISGAGVVNTIQRLLPESVVQRSCLHAITPRLRPGDCFCSVFVGLSIDDSELDVKSQNIWAFTDPNVVQLMNSYKQLPVEKVPDAEPPYLFVSFPSKKDPTWAERYPGKSTLAIITVANYDWFKPWENTSNRKRDVDYNALKNAIGYRLLAQVERLYPQIKGRVDYLEVGSPLSNNFYLNSMRGEIYGLDHSMDRFTPAMMAAVRSETDIKGLYMTGQDTLCCGFLGAMKAGVITSSIILGRRFTFNNEIEAMAKLANFDIKQE